MSPEQIFALLAALTGDPDPKAFETLKAGGADPAFPVTIAPCARPVAPTEIEGQTIICGKVSVPFDHSAPDGENITIAFNLYKARSLSPEPDPVIYLHGGPGSGTVSRVARTISFFEHLRGRRDIIAIDQRGVDTSAPEMDCYSTLGAQLEPATEFIRSGAYLPELEMEFIKGCLNELDAKNIDYSLINTEQNAKDVPAVMSALGYDNYNIYGISYGTKLTMEVLRQNPPGIRSAVIDGNAPPWLPLYSSFWAAHTVPIELSLAPCEKDPICSAEYPNITARTFALIEALDETPVESPIHGTIDAAVPYNLINNRVNMAGDYHMVTPYIPLMVKQLEEGDTSIVDQLLSGDLPPAAVDSNAETVRLAALSAGLSEAEMVQVDAMLAAAEHIKIANETVERAAHLLEADLDQDAVGVSLADVFDSRLANAIRHIEDDAARFSAVRGYLDLRFQEPSLDPLINLIETHFDPLESSHLAGLARQLNSSEIARVFDLIQIDNQTTVKEVEGSFQTYLYACQEDFSDGWNTLEKFRETMIADGNMGPILQEAMEAWISGFFQACSLFNKHPRDGWTDVGSTDVPVLSMNGEIDNQTAGTWGKLAVQNFSNAKLVLVPEAGHGTIRYSQCAKDITAAYIDDPEGEIDISCIEDLRLPVMLPDGTMHPLPY